MKKFNFYVNYVEVNKVAPKITKLGEIPFSTMANTYEEGRSKALEFAQSIARCYESNDESAFFFLIGID